MKKIIALVFLATLCISQKTLAYNVTATNNTDRAITLKANGLGNEWIAIIEPSSIGSVETGGICPWSVEILNADTKLQKPPASVQFNYAVRNHCRSKQLKVSREDIQRTAAGGQQIIVNTATGSNSNIANSADNSDQNIIRRIFKVVSDAEGRAFGGSAEGYVLKSESTEPVRE